MKKIMLRTLIVLLTVSLTSAATASETPHKTLNLLYAVQGTHTLSGMHNKEPNSDPLRYSRQLNSITGKWPALHSGDFLFASVDINHRQTMINEMIAQWNAGAVVNLMWHACSPVGTSPCLWDGGVVANLTDGQWNDLLTDGTALNNRWKARMDEVAVFLQQLEDAGVEVMFRPLHEMNQGLFWWGGRPGPDGTAALYRLTYDYFQNTKGLTNLIWVWNLQDFSTLAADVDRYDPGHEYWDVFSLDMYWSDGQGYTAEKYNAIRNKAAGKPIAIGEAEDLPHPNLLAIQPGWSFFMGWAELTFNNSTSKLNEIYHSPRIVTRDAMPGWDNVSYQVIQAEDYNNMDGVEIVTMNDGGETLVVGSVDEWDWMSYDSINVPVDGLYTFAFRMANDADAVLQLEAAGGGVLTTLAVPATGNKWITLYKTLSLTQGDHAFGIKSTGGSFSLNWFSVSSVHVFGESSASSSSTGSSSSSSSSTASSESSSSPIVSSASSSQRSSAKSSGGGSVSLSLFTLLILFSVCRLITQSNPDGTFN